MKRLLSLQLLLAIFCHITPIRILQLTECAMISPNIGVLCPREDVTLTCRTADENDETLDWAYDGMSIGSFVSSQQPGQTLNSTKSGFQFSLHLIATNPTMSSTLSFTADVAMNGHNVSCFTADNGGGVSASHKMIRVGDIMNCRLPSMADNTVIFLLPSTTEGSVVMFACEFGFRPQDVLSSVCGSNGQWQPDPGLHDCTEVVCGDPSSPINGRVGRPSGSGLGSTVSFQCSEGLSPPWVMNSTCNINGTWSPNPGELICTSPDVSTSSQGSDDVSTTPRTTTTSMMGSVIPVNQGSSSDCVVTAVISSVLFFIVGLVGGLAGGVLVVYCCVKRQGKHHPPPSQPAPLYEDIVTSPVKGEVELQLRDNVAYGQVR